MTGWKDVITLPMTDEIIALAARPYAAVMTREDGDYVFRVPELPGLVTGAPTITEALELLEDAKRAWIASALYYGDPVPEPRGTDDVPRKSGKFTLRLSPAIHDALAREAKRQGVSLNELATNALAIVAARGFEVILPNGKER
jgi:antitoxin HicB